MKIFRKPKSSKLNIHSTDKIKDVAVIGTVGIPAKYGGFETLAQNLASYVSENATDVHLSVYCSSVGLKSRMDKFQGADLRYVGLKANGFQSVLYDAFSLVDAVRRRNDIILVLGVSGAIMIPIVRLFSNVRIVTNIDGIEWKREKWRGFIKLFLRLSERAAVKFSHAVIADNDGVAEYISKVYPMASTTVIAYGGDISVNETKKAAMTVSSTQDYALGLCRIVPENNIALILSAFSKTDIRLFFVGNWDDSMYGRHLKERYKVHPTITLLNPIYCPDELQLMRNSAKIYVHGHSAGGTNPALVEMMHHGIHVLAFDCIFNRYTTENKASYFLNETDLLHELSAFKSTVHNDNGIAMLEIAQRRYTWAEIGKKYMELLLKDNSKF